MTDSLLNIKVDLRAPLDITVVSNPKYFVLIDVTASFQNGNELGRFIINDGDFENDHILINNVAELLNKRIWMKVILYHQRLKNYDFKILISQKKIILYEFKEEGKFNKSSIFYRSMILEG
jgi:hypothetical protein